MLAGRSDRVGVVLGGVESPAKKRRRRQVWKTEGVGNAPPHREGRPRHFLSLCDTGLPVLLAAVGAASAVSVRRVVQALIPPSPNLLPPLHPLPPPLPSPQILAFHGMLHTMLQSPARPYATDLTRKKRGKDRKKKSFQGPRASLRVWGAHHQQQQQHRAEEGQAKKVRGWSAEFGGEQENARDGKLRARERLAITEDLLTASGSFIVCRKLVDLTTWAPRPHLAGRASPHSKAVNATSNLSLSSSR